MQNLGELRCEYKNISNLSGLEHAVNLTELRLGGNQISDISQLSNMTNLTKLDLDDNQISNISQLSNMTNLKNLSLDRNQISDIKSLVKKSSLQALGLSDNQISDIAPLSNMKNLIILDLRNNQISDITPLSNMTNLQHLYLENNQISDITPLNNNTGLLVLMLSNNQISDIKPLSNITSLENINNLVIIDLSNNQISDITALSDRTGLMMLLLKDNKIKDISGLKSASSLVLLDLRNNNLIGEVPSFINDFNNLIYKDESSSDEEYIGILGYMPITSFSGNQLHGEVPAKLRTQLGNDEAFSNNIFEGEPNQKQLTLKGEAALNIPLNSAPTQNMLRHIVHLEKYDSTYEDVLYELELVPTDLTFFDESGKAIKSGTTTAYIKLKGVSDTNTYAKTTEAVPITISNKIGSNNDIYIDFSIDNSLEVALGSNTINFGVVSSVGGEIQSTTLTVSSSLPYDISTMAYGDFIGSMDESNVITIDKISLDIDGLGYKALSKNKTINLGDSSSGLDVVHNLNFKMGNTLGYKKDNYNASIQFIVDTK